jgi:hypothetical protein
VSSEITKCPYLPQGDTDDALPCWEPVEPGEDFCAKHNQVRFALCSGCSGRAVRLCTECRAERPLCGSCKHLGGDEHGRISEHETPLSPGEPESGGIPSTVEKVRNEMAETVVLSMRASRGAGRSDMETAYKVVDDLGVSVLLGVLHGVARQNQGGTPS